MGALGRAYGQKDLADQRAYDSQWYDRQQNDYNTYLNSANRTARNQQLIGLAGGIVGAGVGGYMGGPAGSIGRAYGAGIGAKVGGGFGGLFQ